MSFPRYPAYKPSGVAWLGDVPDHWDLRRLGYYFGERREKVSDRDYQPLSVTKEGIVPQLETAAKTDDGDNRKRVCRGDFVINSRSDRKGSAGLSDLDGSVSLISTVLEPKESVHGAFIHHLLRSVPFQEEFYRFGKGIVADLWSTNYTAMAGIAIAMPSHREQVAIATFLDRESAKIDALIAEQQRLIELLQEKRQAVISHAVTKGLNPDAPMKDSGVEWLGEVPEHWEITKLKRITRQISVGIVVEPSKYYDDEGDAPALRSLNVKPGQINIEDCVYISRRSNELLAKSILRAGDLVLVRTGQPGTCAVVPESLDGCNCIDLIFARKPHQGCSDYLMYQLSSDAARHQYDLGSDGAIQQHFNVKTASNLIIVWPTDCEQRTISSYLNTTLEKLDDLIKTTFSTVLLLQERRSALISAAVTGQIDVRGLVPAVEAA